MDVSGAGTRRAYLTEDNIWDGEGTSVSASMRRTLGAGRGTLKQTGKSGVVCKDDFKAAFFKRTLGRKCTLCREGPP